MHMRQRLESVHALRTQETGGKYTRSERRCEVLSIDNTTCRGCAETMQVCWGFCGVPILAPRTLELVHGRECVGGRKPQAISLQWPS